VVPQKALTGSGPEIIRKLTIRDMIAFFLNNYRLEDSYFTEVKDLTE
jgi:hypothetical protein